MDLTAERLAAFLTGYASLLAEMRAEGMLMLAALAGRDVAAMEKGLNLGQARQKRLAQYEAQRLALQREAGGEGLTLRQMAEAQPEAERAGLLELVARVEEEARQLRSLNQKGLDLAAAQAGFSAAGPPPLAHYAPGAKKAGDNLRPSLETKA